MNLADRLNKALAAQNLSAKPSIPTADLTEVAFEPLNSEAEIIEPIDQYAELGSLTKAIKNAKDVAQDEFGTRILLVKEIDLEEIHLPQVYGDFIIDDIQKRKNGIYEVHLVEKNQK